jgi:glycogen(starch) synthase
MKILFVSNFFPPHWIGGYELGCQQIAQSLSETGHRCQILASNYRSPGKTESQIGTEQPPCSRLLQHTLHHGSKPERFGSVKAIVRDRFNTRVARKCIRDFSPNMIFVWNPMFLTPSTPLVPELSGIPTCFFVSDNWPKNWLESINPDWIKLERFARTIPNRFAHSLMSKFLSIPFPPRKPLLKNAMFASEHLKKNTEESGYTINHAAIVRWGIHRQDYLVQRNWNKPVSKVLFAGQLGEHKGVQTAIEAIHHLRTKFPGIQVALTIAGGDVGGDDESRLKTMCDDLNVSSLVSFRGKISKMELQREMHSHDIFLFPSIWDEPFSIVLVEAMTAGMAVVCTPTGGTPELAVDHENALYFNPGDSRTCASALGRLIKSPDLCNKLSLNAVRSTEQLTIPNMTHKIEHFLLETLHADA